jgi:hypothetical protein
LLLGVWRHGSAALSDGAWLVSCSKFVFVFTLGSIIVALNSNKTVDASGMLAQSHWHLKILECILLHLWARLIRVHMCHCFTYFCMVIVIECTQFLYADHVVL